MTTETIRPTDFETCFDGQLFFPDTPGFAEASAVWNAACAARPALIARPASAEGVAQALRYARVQRLPVAVRGGGHSPAGFGTLQGGLVIDLSGMKALTVDPASRHVRLEPGLTWGEVAAALHEHGLAITAGDVATVGVAGLTQGGGIGWFVRQHGLAVDRLRAVELVTAQGEFLRASEDEHAELFWALRGAGANFGVITALEFEAHAGGLIHGGLLAFPANDPAEAARLMGRFAELAEAAPDSLTMQGLFMAAPPAPFVPPQLVGQTVFLILACYSGDPSGAEAAYAPFRALGEPVVDLIGPMPYPALFELTAEASQRGFRHAIRSGFLAQLTEGALLQLGQEVQTMLPGQMVQLRVLGGQLARLPQEATAFSHRQAPLLMMVGTAVPDASLDEAAWAATERLWASVAPLSSGLYGNFTGTRDAEPAQCAYSIRSQQRLAELKRRHDPENVFSHNVNLRPAKQESVTA